MDRKQPSNYSTPAGVTGRGYPLEPAFIEIGRRLRWARLAKNVSQSRMAAAMLVSAPFLALVERGKTRLSVTDLLNACRFLGVDPLVMVDGLTEAQCQRPPEVRERKREIARRRFAETQGAGKMLAGKMLPQKKRER